MDQISIKQPEIGIIYQIFLEIDRVKIHTCGLNCTECMYRGFSPSYAVALFGSPVMAASTS